MFRSDNLAGTVHGKNLASVRMAEDLENGCIVALGGYEAGSREVRACSAPEADTAIEKIAILGSEEVNKEVKYDTVGGFINKAGSIARGYIFDKGDVFAVTKEAISGEVTVGSKLVVDAGSYKMKAVADAAGATVIGECEAVEMDGATTWYVIRV